MSSIFHEDPEHIAPLVWGKTIPAYKPLSHHLIDAGMVAKILVEEGGFASVARRIAALLRITETQAIAFAVHFVALHDIGKAHAYFQMRAPNDPVVRALMERGWIPPAQTGERYAHEQGTSAALRRALEARLQPCRRKRSLIAALCDVAALHHCRADRQTGKMSARREAYWNAVQDALVRQIEALFPIDWNALLSCTHVDALCALLWGLMILSDWIASGRDVFYQAAELHPASYVQLAPSFAREAIRACGLYAPQQRQASEVDFCAYWDFQFARPMQKEIERRVRLGSVPLLSIIEAPMGEGKTEAALYLAAHMVQAHGKDGFYVAMPTAATSNQMYHRVQAMLARQGVPRTRLLHAMAWLLDETSVEAARGLMEEDDSKDGDAREQGYVDWLRPLRRGMLESYAVGTVDQAMMAALKARFGVLRLFGLSAKVLVIDEMHAYDAYMLSILLRLMQWCAALRVPVVILSATLPSRRRDALIDAYRGALDAPPKGEATAQGHQIITNLSADNTLSQIGLCGAHSQRCVEIETANILGDTEAIAERARKWVKNDGCLCVLVNTVREAQDVYLHLRGRSDVGEVLLFHAGFAARRRKELEEAVVSRFGKDAGAHRPRRAIVVATQVLEQSLDVDFDAMISAIAPIDLLLQRMGRVFRHEGTKRCGITKGSLLILLPQGKAYGSTGYVYFDHVLNATRDVLADRRKITLPDEIRTLVERVYGACSDPENSQAYADWYRMSYAQELDIATARAFELPEPHRERFAGGSIGMTHLFAEEGEGADRSVVRTRLGEDSVSVALVSPQEALTFAARKPTRVESIELWQRSFSMRVSALGEPEAGEMAPVWGMGLLKGLLMLPSADGVSVLRKTRRGLERLVYDDELGRRVETIDRQ